MTLLICFIGLDGSGKSTYGQFVHEKLTEKYCMSSHIVWVKFGLTIFSKLSPLIKNKEFDAIDCANPFKFNHKRKIFSYLYLGELLFEHWLRIIKSVKIPLYQGISIICDRYYFDSIVDIMINFNFPYKTAKNVFNFFIGLPKPDIVFYIKLPAEVAYSRKKDVYDVSYLENRNTVYALIEKDFPLVILDGTKSPEALKLQISDNINSYLMRKQV